MAENEKEEQSTVGPKTAMVCIVGRPSAGKSTFLNTASGERISIVSSIPQTTRNAIRGIVNTSLGQLVFIDTPGLHQSEKKLNLKLTKVATDQIAECDAVLYVVDATRQCGEEETLIAEMLAPLSQKLVVAINKEEDVRAHVDDAVAFVRGRLPGVPEGRILTMSAKADHHVNDVLKALYDLAPVAPHLYPEEFYTDQEVGFRIAEIIRGQAINRLKEEVPHALYVSIEDMAMRTEKVLSVRAFICVERDSQKGIVIGPKGALVREIKVESIKECRKIFPYKVELDLRVKVDKNWRQKDETLTRLIR